MQSYKRKIGEGTLWLSGADTIIKIFGLFYLFLILGQLSVYEYGLLKLILAIPALLSLLSLGGLYQVMIADVAALLKENNLNEVRFKISAYFSIKIVAGLLATIILYTSTYVASNFFADGILETVRLLSLIFLFDPLRSLVLLTLNITHDFKSLAYFSVAEEFFKLLFVVLFLVVLGYGVKGVIIAMLVTNIFTITFFLGKVFSMKNSLLEGKLFSAGFYQPWYVLRFHAKWSIFLASLNTTASNSRPWIIQFFLGTEAVGIYGLATSLLTPLWSLIPVSKVILPIIPAFSSNKAALARFLNSAIKYKLYGQIFLSTIAIICFPFLITYYLPDYKNSYLLFVALTFAFIPKVFSQILGVVYLTFKLQKEIFKATVVNSLAVILILPPAVYLFGLYGAAVELFITQAAFVYGRYKGLEKVMPDYKLPFKEMITITASDRWLFQKIKEKVFKLAGN